MTNLTPKQEKFCQNVASGMTYADSLRESYDTSKYTNDSIYAKSSEMMANVKLMLRVDEIKAECVKDIKYGVEECFDEFKDIQIQAKNKEDINGQMKAVENKGKLKQLFVEQKNITGVIGIGDATDEAFKELMEKSK